MKEEEKCMNDLLLLNSHEATGEIINFVFILF